MKSLKIFSNFNHAIMVPALTGWSSCVDAQTSASIVVNGPGKPISPDLFAIFFEDINYAADGGLCAELIQIRSFAARQVSYPGLCGRLSVGSRYRSESCIRRASIPNL